MITERQFAASFPDFWQELLPLLTPSCVHLLNVNYEESLHDEHGLKIDPVEINEETRDASVVSEFAYHLAKEAFQQKLLIDESFKDNSIRRVAEASAFDLINRYEGNRILSYSCLDDAELDEGLILAKQYESFALLHGGLEKCTFQVPIKGCGIIHSCYADLVIGDDCLVEVKTVKRQLSGKDVRQLIVYLALSSITNPHLWKHVIFFNPRRATFHKFQAHELIEFISGGKSVVDVYTELLEFVCSSDAQIDSIF
jgi:hypothetical protein